MGLATLGPAALTGNPGSDKKERERERMISASSALNGVGMTSDEAAEVFRSMKVETTSKTPYSDATQVRRSFVRV